MAHHLAAVYAALDDAIAADRGRELTAFARCQEPQAYEWADEIALLMTIKQILERGSLDAWAHRG